MSRITITQNNIAHLGNYMYSYKLNKHHAIKSLMLS